MFRQSNINLDRLGIPEINIYVGRHEKGGYISMSFMLSRNDKQTLELSNAIARIYTVDFLRLLR